MTIVDTFNRADSASTLGTTSDGRGVWTPQFSAVWGISSNQAYAPTLDAHGVAIATIDSGTADGVVGVTPATVGAAGCGVAFRYANDLSYWIAIANNTSAFSGLWKTDGTGTHQIQALTIAAGDAISVSLSGSSITVSINGTAQTPVTDSYNSTMTKHGLYVERTTHRLDDYTAPGGTAPTSARRPRITVGRSLFASSGLR